MTRIDDDRRILEAATDGPWSLRYAKSGFDRDTGIIAPDCANVLAECFEEFLEKGIRRSDLALKNATCIVNARNRMHLYHALARAVRGLKAPSKLTWVPAIHEEQLERMAVVYAAYAAIEAREEK
uniref:Uncharacterized protein n=1 Tax=viral metagenome TaxID=1070528 RepID=A0A6H2A5M5_9ZZZZ